MTLFNTDKRIRCAAIPSPFNSVIFASLVCACLAINTPAYAADTPSGQLKPGQWETRITTNAATIASMPALPPEQLAKMKEMGIDIPAIAEALASHPMIVQQCISPEQARLDKPFTPQDSKDCKVNNYKHAGNKVSGEIICSGQMQGTGKFDMTLSSSTDYQATTHINGSGNVNGTPTGPIDQHYDISGKWLKASCDPNIIGNGAIQ